MFVKYALRTTTVSEMTPVQQPAQSYEQWVLPEYELGGVCM